jgi:hypothetical protein
LLCWLGRRNMPLNKEQMAPRDPRVMLIDTKNMDLDRALINLFMVLKHRGWYPLSRSGVRTRTAEGLARWPWEDTVNFPGFAAQPELTRAWLEADFLDLVKRGTEKEALAAPRPVHLNAYKLRNAQRCKDYGATPQLYRLLADEDDDLPVRLRRLLLHGVDEATDKYMNADVDLETLTILRLADREGADKRGDERVPDYAPLCTGQGRLLRNDTRRLLQYAEVIPRPVWVEYFKTLCGFHLVLFVRRTAAQVSAWLRDCTLTPACLECPVKPMAPAPLEGCPFPLEFFVDMGSRHDTRMAALSQASAEAHFRAIDEFVRDLVTLTKLIQFVDMQGPRIEDPRLLVERALAAREHPNLPGYAQAQLSSIVGTDERLARIKDAMADDPFRAYVECILSDRHGFYRKYFRGMFRSLLQPNQDTGLLVSGRSPRSPGRFHLGTRLLETLVQVAVLKPDGQDAAGQPRFRSEPILVRELLAWLYRRYGLVISAAQVADHTSLAPADLHALRENEEHFKTRLREIGFYTDLSDAASTQRVTPRYLVEA